jgi:hypothetical protein
MDSYTSFIPTEPIPRYSYYTCIVVAFVLLAFVVTDSICSSLDEQFKGHPKVFPRAVYISLITTFYVSGFIYAIFRWFYTYAPTDDDIPLFIQNLNWNFSSFFLISFLFYIYTLFTAMQTIFLFTVVFAIQISCAFCMVLFSSLKGLYKIPK